MRFLGPGMVEVAAALNKSMDFDSNNFETIVSQVVYNQVMIAKGQQHLFKHEQVVLKPHSRLF